MFESILSLIISGWNFIKIIVQFSCTTVCFCKSNIDIAPVTLEIFLRLKKKTDTEASDIRKDFFAFVLLRVEKCCGQTCYQVNWFVVPKGFVLNLANVFERLHITNERVFAFYEESSLFCNFILKDNEIRVSIVFFKNTSNFSPFYLQNKLLSLLSLASKSEWVLFSSSRASFF